MKANERLIFEDAKFVVENKETHTMEQCAQAYASIKYYQAELKRDSKEAKAVINGVLVTLEEYMERQFRLGDAGTKGGWDRIKFEQTQLPLTLGGKAYTPFTKQEITLTLTDEKTWKALVEGDPIKYRKYVKFVQNTKAITNDILAGTAMPEVRANFRLDTQATMGLK